MFLWNHEGDFCIWVHSQTQIVLWWRAQISRASVLKHITFTIQNCIDSVINGFVHGKYINLTALSLYPWSDSLSSYMQYYENSCIFNTEQSIEIWINEADTVGAHVYAAEEPASWFHHHVRKVVGSRPGRVIPKTIIKMVHNASLLNWHAGVRLEVWQCNLTV